MGAITPDEVTAHLGIGDPDVGSPDEEHLVTVVDAVNAMVPRIVASVRGADPVLPWPGDVQAGAVMLGARLYSRRASPTGVTTFIDAGPSYISRYDPDLERLFGIGGWAPPRVG